MTKYIVTMNEQTFEVEAESRDAAYAKGRELSGLTEDWHPMEYSIVTKEEAEWARANADFS